MRFFSKNSLTGLVWIISTLLLAFPINALAETITVAGTGDSQYLLQQLAQKFEQQHPGSKIIVPHSVGSGGGIKLLLAGRTDLARIARPLKPKEQKEGLHTRIFAYSPIVFVANLPTRCLQNISAAEIKEILQGKLNNWQQLGSCSDHKIYVANREEGDSSKVVIETQIPSLKEVTDPVGRTIYSTPEACATLNRYPYSFGYLPKSQITKNSLTILDFEGVSASAENVQAGRYKLIVPLGIVWRGEPTGLTKQFLEYLFSPEAQSLMQKLNTVPATSE